MGVPVGHLFVSGQNPGALEVWRPYWFGIGQVTYHTRVELVFDQAHWTPGGVAFWFEAWGWWSTGLEGKIRGADFNIPINT